MPEEPEDYEAKAHALFLKERDGLIDAARESARTFDKAVLAFGSAVFGASIAFIKDVAPKPQPSTLVWLAISWGFFSIGLLAVILSFLFSHKACMFEIDVGTETLRNPDFRRPSNRWSSVNDWSNYLCVAFLFAGLLAWSVFAFRNLTTVGGNACPPQNVQSSQTR
jgi:hypothetical protein